MVGKASIVDTTVHALQLLEYRGYDSYGVVTVDDGALTVVKDVGPIGRAVRDGKLAGVGEATLALAHTRWATHGKVSPRNAHPHVSYDSKVAVVHNGVIENHARLRRELEASGVEFASETDSEVIAHLVARELESTGDLLTAIGRTTGRLAGEFAIAVISIDDPETVYGAKLKSPLLLTYNGQEAVLASDQMATSEIAGEVMYLDDGDVVRLRTDAAHVFTRSDGGGLEPAHRAFASVAGRYRVPDKGRFDHYMLKEIHETPAAVKAALRIPSADLASVVPASEDGKFTMVGAGSAFYVALIAQYFFAKLTRLEVAAYSSDEAGYLARFREGDALVAISQSGETFDTLEISRTAVAAGAVLTSLTNVPNSTLERLAAHNLRQGAGPEICVLSTKSIVSQVLVLIRAALEHGHATGMLDDDERVLYEQSLQRLPATLQQLLSDEGMGAIRTLAEKYSAARHWFFIARGSLYPVALESALKFKEVSYHHAEGMPAGFFKHGTISLIDENFYTVALLPSKKRDPERFSATLSNISEIKARGGPVIGLGPSDVTDDDLADFAEYLRLPYHDDDVCDVLIQLVAGQLLAYYCALSLGRDIDQPRSLAKSVTVR
jgi:glucosamine--fructose-6-phosphate aminotransferase (isomerizing)